MVLLQQRGGTGHRAGLPGHSSPDKPAVRSGSIDVLPVLSPATVSARPGDLLSDAERAATDWVSHREAPTALALSTGAAEAEPPARWGQAVAPARLEDAGERARPSSASEYHRSVCHSALVEVARQRAANRVLAMRGADATDAADTAADLATAQQLELSDADVTELSVASVAACLAGNRALVSLDLSGAVVGATQHSMAVLLLALEEHPSLAHLDVHGLPMHPKNLSSFLQCNSRVESLDLYGCYDVREELTDGCWVALRYDLHEHSDLVARKDDVVCARRDGSRRDSWRVCGAAVPAAQLRRACFSDAGSLALLADGLRSNKGLLHINMALHGGGCATSLASTILAHPKLVSFNSVPLRAPAGGGAGGAGGGFALTVAHLAGLTEMSLLAERWLAPPLGQAPIVRQLAPAGGVAGYGFASLVELRLDGSGGGLDSGAMQMLFQGLTRQGKRLGQITAAADVVAATAGDGGVGGGGGAVALQTLVVVGAVVPAESVAGVLRSHSGLTTLDLSGVTDSPYATGVPHAGDLSAVLRSLAQTPDGHDQGTTGLWLKEVGVSQELRRLRYVRRVDALTDYSSHLDLDGKQPPHPQRRLPRRVWLAEEAQRAHHRPRPHQHAIAAAGEDQEGPLLPSVSMSDREGVVVVRVMADPQEGLGVVLEDEIETNNAFVLELLDTSTGMPGAAERAGMAVGAAVIAVDGHSVLGLGCVAVAAKVRVARAAGRAATFTMGAGEDERLARLRAAAVTVAATAGGGSDGHFVALTQSVRDGPAGLVERKPAKRSICVAVEDLEPAGYAGGRALSVLGAALRLNRSLTSLNLTVNPSVVAPRPTVHLDAAGQRRVRRKAAEAAYPDGADGVEAAPEWELGSGARHAQTFGGTALVDAADGLPHWALSWSEVSGWVDAVVARSKGEAAATEGESNRGVQRLAVYNGLTLAPLVGDTLQELDLRRRLIGGDGALILAHFLPDMVNLKRLVSTQAVPPQYDLYGRAKRLLGMKGALGVRTSGGGHGGHPRDITCTETYRAQGAGGVRCACCNAGAALGSTALGGDASRGDDIPQGQARQGRARGEGRFLSLST